jgi:predicted RNA-binding protein YlxR (DUF448 family)
MNDRTCIVTRETSEAASLIRFVAGPDGSVVPDLKHNLPGRGCWVTATREKVDIAARRNLFRKALRADVRTSAGLGQLVDDLLARAALGALGLARKAGDVALGAVKVVTAVRSGEALAVLHAAEASEDGVRKIDQARRAVAFAGGPDIAAFNLFSEAQMSLALGGTNVIHAAVLARPAGNAALRRIIALDSYRKNGGQGDAARSEDGQAPQKDLE